MESAQLEKTGLLGECQEQVRAAQATRDNLVKQVETRTLQKAQAERLVGGLEASRAEVIANIGRGSASDADLAKVKKELSRAKDAHLDTAEILMSTEASLKEAESHLARGAKSLKAEEDRAWRQASASLIEKHRAQIQASYDEIFVAVNCHQPMTLYFSLVNSLGLKVPEEAEYLRIRGRLAQEFGI